jgi:hypothetical protein
LLLALTLRHVRWGVAFALLLALALTYWPIDTSFEVAAETELLSVKLASDQVGPRWHFSAATLFDGDRTGQPFEGSLQLTPGSEVLFERIEEGPLRIRITADHASAGKLYGADAEEIAAAASRVVLVISDFEQRSRHGESVVLPFVGEFRLGRAIGRETSALVPLVQRATIRMLGTTLGWGTRFDSGAVDLETGDSFALNPPETAAVGIVRVARLPAMTIVLHAVSNTAIVSRFGAEGYLLRTSLLSRVTKDPLLQLAWTAVVFLVGVHQKVLHEKRDA